MDTRSWAAALWCTAACWDIFADWCRLKHSWPVFTGLSVLKAYLRWKGGGGGAADRKKVRGKKERAQGKKADFRTAKDQRDLCSCVICLLSFDPPVGFLSVARSPAFLFLSFTHRKRGCMYTRPLTTRSPSSLPLCDNKMLFVSPVTSCILDTQCTES